VRHPAEQIQVDTATLTGGRSKDRTLEFMGFLQPRGKESRDGSKMSAGAKVNWWDVPLEGGLITQEGLQMSGGAMQKPASTEMEEEP